MDDHTQAVTPVIAGSSRSLGHKKTLEVSNPIELGLGILADATTPATCQHGRIERHPGRRQTTEGEGNGHGGTADLAGDGNGGGYPAAGGRGGPGAGRVAAAPAPWEAMAITSICVKRWIPTGQGAVPDLRVELTAIGGVPVFGELLFEVDQQQKGPWHSVAADVFIGEGESLVVAYVAKIDWAARFRLHAAVVDDDPTTLGPGQGLAATGWFEPARLIPMC